MSSNFLAITVFPTKLFLKNDVFSEDFLTFRVPIPDE